MKKISLGVLLFFLCGFFSEFVWSTEKFPLPSSIDLLKKANQKVQLKKKPLQLDQKITPTRPPYAAPPPAISYDSALYAQICKQIEGNCAESLASSEAVPFPIERVYECAEQEEPACERNRYQTIIKIMPSPPAPPIGPMIGRFDPAISCKRSTGLCEWKYATDYDAFEPHAIWETENAACHMATLPLGDEEEEEQPECRPVVVDRFSVAIQGELVSLEFVGTNQGCLIPQVRGAPLPSHRNFNRDRDYTEVITNREMGRRNCPGSYQVQLQNGQVCRVPCAYEVSHCPFPIPFADQNDLLCSIILRAPVCE